MSRERMTIVGLLLLLAFFVGRSTVAFPAFASFLKGGIPDKQGLIHGCYGTKGGSLRVFDPSHARCGSGETKLVWQQRGPRGPMGATGPTGPTGNDGYTRAVHQYVVPAGYVCNPPSGSSLCVVDSVSVPTIPAQVTFACSYNKQIWAFDLLGCGGSVLPLWENGILVLVVDKNRPANSSDVTYQYEAVYKLGP